MAAVTSDLSRDSSSFALLIAANYCCCQGSCGKCWRFVPFQPQCNDIKNKDTHVSV